MDASEPSLRACRTCGLIQCVPLCSVRERVHCLRCDSPFTKPPDRAWTTAAALAALTLYPVAMCLPVLSIERLGLVNQTDIWHGAWRLVSDGHLVIGMLVLVCSILVPLVKLTGLLVLNLAPGTWRHRHRALTWRLIEAAGRWGMIDVMLVAGIVASVKLGDLVNVSAGPGASVYATMVLLSLLAGATFDPHGMWSSEEARA